ncbi:40S ribosomal protein S19, partial [Striga asiatica]
GMYFEVGLVKSLNFWGVPSEEEPVLLFAWDVMILLRPRIKELNCRTDLSLILPPTRCFVHGKMELPDWIDLVKTDVLKELAPYDPDWYYIRAASMARKLYLRGGLGVGAFRRIYGRSKRNDNHPPHFGKSSGSVARNILQ